MMEKRRSSFNVKLRNSAQINISEELVSPGDAHVNNVNCVNGVNFVSSDNFVLTVLKILTRFVIACVLWQLNLG